MATEQQYFRQEPSISVIGGLDDRLGSKPELMVRHATQVTVPDVSVVTPIRWAFYGFIATIPFETLSLGIPVEITAISLTILFLSLIFQPGLVFRTPPAAYLFFAVSFI